MTESGADVKDRIKKDTRKLRDAVGGRVWVWRYVESQKALFGFATSDPIANEPPQATDDLFASFIAFVREPMPKHDGIGIREIKDSAPFWDIRPEGQLRRRAEGTARWVLTAKKSVDDPGTELLGVVEMDVPEEQGGLDDEKITRRLTSIRDALRTYSLLQFYDGFKTAREFIRSGEPTLELRDAKTIESQLETLIKNLRADESPVSIYVRRVPAEKDSQAQKSPPNIPIAGVGDFYRLLRDAETSLPSEASSDYYHASFSQHAYELLKDEDVGAPPRATPRKRPETEGVLFPGGGNAENYKVHKQRLESAQEQLCKALIEGGRAALVTPVEDASTEMINKGSFGVFPIRWGTATETHGPLIALLCIAVQDIRHFFTWTRCLLIEQFCQRLGRQHSDIAPFLANVDKITHAELLSARDVLRRVAPDGILVPHVTKEERQCFAFVLSVDIRKSTDLMARMVPEHADFYGRFLIELWNDMKAAVLEEYGIFDKFTGDGILAYFPDFFEVDRRSAALRLLRAVEKCHDAFRRAYPRLWKGLSAVPAMGSADQRSDRRTGLGIGLDFGTVQLVNVGTELTIVGAPVVYACRLSSAAWAFTTLANYPCYHAFKLSQILDLIECRPAPIEIKHDEIHAYRVSRRSWLSAPPHNIKRDGGPAWDDGWETTEA
jgi:class 3 adenylate cyclase